MGVPLFVRNQYGKPVVNPLKLHVENFSLVPDSPNYPVSLVAGALPTNVIMTVGQDGPFEAMYLSQYRTSAGDAVMVEILDDGSRRRLTSGPAHIDTIFGSMVPGVSGIPNGYAPSILTETLFVQPMRTIRLILSAPYADNVVYPVIHGRKWYNYLSPVAQKAIAKKAAEKSSMISIPYFMPIDPVTVASGASTTTYIKAPSDMDFELTKITCVSTGGFTFQIVNTSTRRASSNGPIPVGAGMGSASFPFILTESMIIQANTQLEINIANLYAGNNTIYITLCGRAFARVSR